MDQSQENTKSDTRIFYKLIISQSTSYLHIHLSIDTEGRISMHLLKWEIHFEVELQWEEIWGRHFINLANRKKYS